MTGPSGARGDSAVFQLETVTLNSHPPQPALKPSSRLPQPLYVLFVCECVCVPLPGFPVCYCGHGGGRRAGIGEVCVVRRVPVDPAESDTLLAERSVF